MCSPLRSAEPRGRAGARQAGFTLVELMVGVLIGILASLAVTHVLVNFESQKRSTTSGSDSQVNGALALDLIQRSLQPAGYGFSNNQGALGCTLVASFGGAAVAGFPATLAPVVITDGGATGAPDSISILASGRRTYSVPSRIVSPGANPAANPTAFPLASALGIEGPVDGSDGNRISSGDLMVAVRDGMANCDVFQVTSIAGSVVARASTSSWNPAGALSNAYLDGSYLVNLGAPLHRTFTIAGDSLRMQALQLAAANGAPSYPAATELFSGIVNLQAQYGRDTNNDGAVDAWDNTTPTTNATWRQLLAVRLAVVARSTQYEKDIVTGTCPTWDGVAIRIPASPNPCGSYPSADDEEWKHYRYKVFETVVPLRNLLWRSS